MDKTSSIRKLFFFLGLLLIATTGVLNLGIIAFDDYAFVISQVVPAQFNSSSEILKNIGLWYPLQPWLLHKISSIAFSLGVEDPYRQLQIVLFFSSVFVFTLLYHLGTRLFQEEREKTIFTFLLSFYFVSPLFFSRPMIETISSPFILLSCFFACKYWNQKSLTALSIAIVALSIASLFRYQSGICILALLILVFVQRSLKDFLVFSTVSLLCFLFIGLFDLVFTGQFFGALKSYLLYNIGFAGANHGVQPWYVFVLLFFALSLPPTFLFPSKTFSFAKAYRSLLPVLLYFGVFVFSHTLSPHKEERHMIPVLPLFLVLLVPLATEVLKKGLFQWRPLYFLTLNFLLLIPASFNVPQINIIGLVRFIHTHPNFTELLSLEDTLDIYPRAYTTRQIEPKKIERDSLDQLEAINCDTALAVREDLKEGLSPYLAGLIEVKRFSPGFLEAALVKLNPKRNTRRGAITLYRKKECR